MGTASVSRQTSFIIRHSVAAFFILAMLLGGGTVFLVVKGILPPGVTLISALSASIAGITMTAVEDGRAGLKLMLHRLLIWRVEIGYWLFVFLFFFLAILLGSFVNPLLDGDPPSFNNIMPTFEILPLFIGFFIIAGLGQELGWTGFLIPRLQARYGALTSCIIRAILVAIWHLPLFLYAGLLTDFPYGGWIAQEGLLLAMGILFLVFLVPWSIFFSWIFNNTKGSLLLVAVLHGSEFWVAYWMLTTGIDSKNLNNYWGYGAILVATSIIIVITTGPQNLSRKHLRIAHQSSTEQVSR